MAKVSFTALTPIKGKEDKIIKFEDKNIVVKQYLPIKEKAELVDYVIQLSFDDKGLFSPLRQRIYKTVGFLKWYTDINFTDTMLINIEKTYDAILLNGLSEILDEINDEEYNLMNAIIDEAIVETKDYIRSFAGQLNATKRDYDETNFDMEKIKETLQDPTQIGFVKEVMEKMG